MNETTNIPEPERQLFHWYLAGIPLHCRGSITVIKHIDPMLREVYLQDVGGAMDFDEALNCLKPLLSEGNDE